MVVGINLPYHSVGKLGDMLNHIQSSGYNAQVFGLDEPSSKLIGSNEVAVWPQMSRGQKHCIEHIQVSRSYLLSRRPSLTETPGEVEQYLSRHTKQLPIG